MVNLTRIYTRTGDDGTTGLGDFSRIAKTDARLVAYADVDETGAAIGVAVATGGADDDVAGLLRRIQNDLFDVGADLCVPLRPQYDHPPLRVEQTYVEDLETECDRYNAQVAPLRTFVLRGGTPIAAHLHLACTVARRAERAVWAAIEAHGTETDGGVNPLTARYLNRLSDLLFILARHANLAAGDLTWAPGGGRPTPPQATG